MADDSMLPPVSPAAASSTGRKRFNPVRTVPGQVSNTARGPEQRCQGAWKEHAISRSCPRTGRRRTRLLLRRGTHLAHGAALLTSIPCWAGGLIGPLATGVSLLAQDGFRLGGVQRDEVGDDRLLPDFGDRRLRAQRKPLVGAPRTP